jgi:hypothetical protein
VDKLTPGFETEGTYSPDNLIAGDFPVITEGVTIKAGQNLSRGAVLGKITSTGEYRLSVTPAAVGEEGSEVPRAILLQNTDASAAAKAAPVSTTGEFNERALILGTGHTLASIKDGLHDRSIFLRPSVKA